MYNLHALLDFAVSLIMELVHLNMLHCLFHVSKMVNEHIKLLKNHTSTMAVSLHSCSAVLQILCYWFNKTWICFMWSWILRHVLDALQQGASQFEASAGKLKRKYWWKNCKVSQQSLFLYSICGILIIVHIYHCGYWSPERFIKDN